MGERITGQLSLLEKDAPREPARGLNEAIFRLVDLPAGETLLACQPVPEAMWNMAAMGEPASFPKDRDRKLEMRVYLGVSCPIPKNKM